VHPVGSYCTDLSNCFKQNDTALILAMYSYSFENSDSSEVRYYEFIRCV